MRLRPLFVPVLTAGWLAALAAAGPASAATPDAPTGVTGTPQLNAVEVSWQAPASDGGASISGYTVTASPGGATCTDTDLDCTVTGLTAGTPYTFTVTATNSTGETSLASEASAPVTPLAPTPPPPAPTAPSAPTAVSATPVTDQKAASVSWTAPAQDGGAPITRYTVRAWTGSTVAKEVSVAGDLTTATVSGLAFGTSYTFTVVATNSAGSSSASAAPGVVTPRVHTTISVTAPRNHLYGSAVTVSGTRTRVDTAGGAGRQPVALQYRTPGTSAWHRWRSTVAAANGTVAFTGLRPTRSLDIRLFAPTAGPFLSTASPARALTVHARVTERVTDATITYPQAATITGTVAPNQAGRWVALQRHTRSGWVRVAAARLDGRSRFTVHAPRTNAGRQQYRVSLAAAPTLGNGVGPSVTVRVSPRTSATHIAISRTSVTIGESATVSGWVAPASAGHSVALQRWNGSGWSTLARHRLSNDSRYAFSVTPGHTGTVTYRVFDPAITGRVKASASPSVALAVHAKQQAPQANCTPGYSPCIPDLGTDVDCAGGSGNGPRYVQGPVRVTGSDPYGLDSDGDGWGCES